MRVSSLLVLLLASVSVCFAQNVEEGDLATRVKLVREIPPDKDHPILRKVISAEESELSCQPTAKKILAVHYRAKPQSEISMNDDRIVIAVEEDGQFQVLKVEESDVGISNGALYSNYDFEVNFIAVGRERFLEIRTTFSGSGASEDDVYSISSDDKLSIVPFDDATKSKLLQAGEEFRHGGFSFDNGVFTLTTGAYKAGDPECCPSSGEYHAQFKLEGRFKPDADHHVFRPDFKFVVEKEWRTHEP